MYLDHRTVDGKCNIIVDAYITKGNVHDSQPYIDRLKYIKRTYNFSIKAVGLDSGYYSVDIMKYLLDEDILGVISPRRFGTKESRKFKAEYIYDEEKDYYHNRKTGEVLEYQGLIDRNGYKTYINPQKDIILRRSITAELTEIFRGYRLSKEGKEIYKRRKETVERSFADSKQNHGYRYALHRGLNKNQNYTWLICAAQNMKNIAMKTEKTPG